MLADETNFIVYSSHVKAAVERDTGAITGTPAVGAVVAYTVGNGGYINAEVLTTTVSGQIANATYGHGEHNIEKITVNNTPYTVSYFAETSANDDGAAAFKAGLNAVIYLDKYGYVAYVDYTQAVDYAQVNTIGVYDVKTTSGAPTGLYAIESQLVFADGTTKNVTVDAIVGTDGVAHTAKDIATNSLYGYNSATSASLPDLELDAFTYAVNATTGNYTLTMIPAEAQKNATIYASQFFAKIGGQFPYVANNATTFVVRTGTAATGYTWTVYTGFEKLPSLVADKATVTVVNKNGDNVQDLVFIESNYDFVAANEYVYITSSYPTVNYVNGLVVSYTYPTTDGTITVSAQGLINYEWVTHDPDFGDVKHSATVSALNFVGGDITCTKAHTSYTGCTDGHRATTFNGVGLYKVTQKDAAGAVTLLEKVDVRTVVEPGYEGLIKVKKIANEDAVAPIQENWHYNSNSKLVVFVDGVPTDGFTFETLYANSYEKDEYSVQAEIIPQTVVQGSTVVATDWIGTMYVTITLNH